MMLTSLEGQPSTRQGSSAIFKDCDKVYVNEPSSTLNIRQKEHCQQLEQWLYSSAVAINAHSTFHNIYWENYIMRTREK